MKETLREYVDSRGVKMRVDRQRGVILGVKILGLESRNGRRYPIETLTRAVALYEGAKVNVNHTSDSSGGPRDYRDRIGAIRNVRLRPQEGLFADFHFNPKHALAEQLIWDAEHAAENVGFSHNVYARTARRGELVQVEAITKVESVDLVADPATTQGLFEAAAEPQQQDPQKVGCPAGNASSSSDAGREKRGGTDVAATEDCLATLDADTLRRRRPELVEQLLRESRGELESLRSELLQLRESVSAQQRERLIERLLAEFDLSNTEAEKGSTAAAVDRKFMYSLREAADEQEVLNLIRERAELVRVIQRDLHAETAKKLATAGKPLCRAQTAFMHNADNTKSFVNSITRRL